MLIDIIAGARPNFMKIAPIIRAINAKRENGSTLSYRLIHTGQHYDKNMSEQFFEQLGIPEPDHNLSIGSGTHAEQTAGIMIGYETILLDTPSNLCLVVGDVTSTMACAIVAQKLHIRVAHVEAGIRSGDWTMPEEINRIVTDAVSNYFFTTSEGAGIALRKSGVDKERIYFVGNTMIDTLVANMDRLRKPDFLERMGINPGAYLVLTLHRPSNVDVMTKFYDLLKAISESARRLPVIFPLHPRTAKMYDRQLAPFSNILTVPPQPYLEFNWLVRNSKCVVTDSGGISEETTYMGIPCLTLRDTTERPETVEIGTNELVGNDFIALRDAIARVHDGHWSKGCVPDKWDGKAAERIADILDSLKV